jgi:hypothetical protein
MDLDWMIDPNNWERVWVIVIIELVICSGLGNQSWGGGHHGVGVGDSGQPSH